MCLLSECRLGHSLRLMVLALCLAAPATAAVHDLRLLADVDHNGHNISEMLHHGGQWYFVRADKDHGQELWVSDGTNAGTRMVIDIISGLNGSKPRGFFILNNTVHFFATSDGGVTGLYKTDGTEAGTNLLVSGIQEPSTSRGVDDGPGPHNAVFNNRFIYQGDSSATGLELFTTDGTTAGSGLLMDIQSGSASSTPSAVVATSMGVFFQADDGTNGAELWLTDGALGGTTSLVTNIADASISSSPAGFIEFGGKVFFAADDGFNGRELWSSDGTAAGTTLFLDINTTVTAAPSDPKHFGILNGDLYFAANDGLAGTELWRVRASDSVTALAVEFTPGSTGTNFLGDTFVEIGSRVVFEAKRDLNNVLFSTNGSDSQTLSASLPSNSTGNTRPLGEAGSVALLGLDDGTNGREVWSTSGTDLINVKDIVTGTMASDPAFAASDGTVVLFSVADDGVEGNALYRSEGTTASTTRVAPIAPGPDGGSPTRALVQSGQAYFGALAGDSSGLYITDGATITPTKLRSFSGTAKPDHIAPVGSGVVFAATTSTTGRELWFSDGTAGGTSLLKDINVSGDSKPEDMIRIGSHVFFAADNGTIQRELWVTDGTAANTYLIQDFADQTFNNAEPHGFHDLNGKIVGIATNGAGSKRLFIAGSGQGSMVDLGPIGDSWDGALTVLGSAVLYAGGTSAELWTSDGVSTNLLMDLDGTSAATVPQHFHAGNNVAWCITRATTSPELWSTDGTAANTKLVTTLTGASSLFRGGAVIGDTFYFAFDDSAGGVDLWKSDSSTAVKLATGWNLIEELAAFDGWVYFRGQETSNTDTEGLYRTDGTNVELAYNIVMSGQGTNPKDFSVHANGMLFSASTPETGDELWMIGGLVPSTTVSWDSTGLAITEGSNSNMVLTFDPPPSETLTVSLARDTSSQWSRTEVGFSESVTIIPNASFVGTAFSSSSDNLDEDTETGNVVITGVSGIGGSHIVGSPDTLSVDVIDAPVLVSLTDTTSLSVAEGDTFTVGFTISPQSQVAFDVTLAASNGVAAADFNGLSPITIPANVGTYDHTVDVVSDATDESTESGTLQIINPTEGVQVGSKDQVAIDVIDSSVVVSFADTTGRTVNEGESFQVTVAVNPASVVDFDIGFNALTPTDGGDFSTLGSHTIPAGAETWTITIDALADSSDEDTESGSLEIAGATAGVAVGTPKAIPVTVIDDPLLVSFADTASLIMAEGDTRSVSYSLSPTPASDVTVEFGFTGGPVAADFDKPATPIVRTVPAGVAAVTFTLGAAHDGVDEDTETGSLVITKVSAANGGVAIGTPSSKSIELADGPVTIAFADSSAVTVSEGGSVFVPFTITPASADSFTIDLVLVGGDLTTGDLSGIGSVTIPAGLETASLSIGAVDDGIGEGSETSSLEIGNPSGGVSVGGLSSVQLTTVEGNALVFFPDTTSLTLDESDTRSLVLAISQPVAFDVDIRFTVVNDAASADDALTESDVTAVPSSVTLPANAETVSFTLSALSDATDENTEAGLFAIDSVSGGAGIGVGSTNGVSLTVLDTPIQTIFTTPLTVTLDEGQAQTLTVQSLPAPLTAYDVFFNVSGELAFADFAPIGPVTIPAGASTATLSLNALLDGLDEGSESGAILIDSLSDDSHTIGAADQVTTTVNDVQGTAAVAFAQTGGLLLFEGQSQDLTVLLSSQQETLITVDLALTGFTDGAFETIGSATFEPGETTAVVQLVSIEDTAAETIAEGQVVLDAVTAGDVAIAQPSSRNVQLRDDDYVIEGLGLLVDGAAAGGEHTFTVGQSVPLLIYDGTPPYRISITGGASVPSATSNGAYDFDDDGDNDPGRLQYLVPRESGTVTVSDSTGEEVRFTFTATALAARDGTAQSVPTSSGGATIFAPVAGGTPENVDRLLGLASDHTTKEFKAGAWDLLTQTFVQLPAEPTGGLSPTHGVFVATRSQVDLSLSGSPLPGPVSVVLRPVWNLVGIPAIDGRTDPIQWNELTLTDEGGMSVPATEISNLIGTHAYLWNGSSYENVTELKPGTCYWFRNQTADPAMSLILHLPAGGVQVAAAESAVQQSVSGYRWQEHGEEPPAPGGGTGSRSAAGSGSGGCATGLGLILPFLLLGLYLRGRREHGDD